MSHQVFSFQFSVLSLWLGESSALRPRSLNPEPRTLRFPRGGATILEVIFAILITTIGLLGAVSILPVASSQARRGRVNDTLTAAGRASTSRLDAMGLRQPERWLAFHANFNDLHGGAYSFANGAQREVWTEFDRYRTSGARVTPPARNWLGGVDSFCIDPRLIAANRNTFGIVAQEACVFPTYTTSAVLGAGLTPPSPFMWRITLNNFPGSTQPMSKIMADAVCQIDDDMTFERDKDRSKPANMPFDDFATGIKNAVRRTDGHFSWMATLVPERNATPQWSSFGTAGQLPINDLYTLSMVMFHDRPADLSAVDPLHERLVEVFSINGEEDNENGGAIFFNPAHGGGEFELRSSYFDASVQINGEPLSGKHLLKVKPNDWICLAGQTVHQARIGGTGGPIYVPIFKWYRISDCEPEVTQISANPDTYQRYVTLIGQDWPLPALDLTPAPDPKNNLRTWAIIVEGVAGVYEKSVKLEIGADQ